MRAMLRLTFGNEAGNKAVQSGAIGKIFGDFAEKFKPEASYFYADKGRRAAVFFLDVKDSSMLPLLAEPFFAQLDASVELIPVMSPEDLQKGIAQLG